MPSRIAGPLAALLTLGVLTAVPASAAPSITAGVAVAATPAVADEGSAVVIDAVYDETGGLPTGDFTFRFGDGATRSATPVDLDPAFAASTDHIYTADGTYTVTALVAADAGTYKGFQRVTVVDVAPWLAQVSDVIAGLGTPYTLELPFRDPGVADIHRITVDWGDGTVRTYDPAVGDRSPVVSHTYTSRGGPFPASVTIADTDNGASATRSFSVTVVSACAGKPVTIDMVALGVTSVVGTAGDDVILGTRHDDHIDARAGDDTVCAAGGDDTVIGGRGSDEIWGDSGDDVLSGRDGSDSLVGGSGNDTLRGGAGNDTLDGGGNDDRLLGDGGHDLIKGGSGADRLIGGSGDDDLDGGTGRDVMNGSGGDDILRGSGDADVLAGGGGDDVLLGGGGDDRLRGAGGNDVLHGGEGRDDLDGGSGTDLLFVSEYPDRDTMDGGRGVDAVRVGKRGTEAAGIRLYATEDEALAFQGSYLLSDFTTYHNCCENRVINIQLMADAVGGHIVMPGEAFSINDVVGKRTVEKGYKPAGAIIAGYVQCCNYAENIGGGTSQFATTFYNAVFFSAMEDLEHQPHTAWFSRYPQGREATMGYPHPDVKFRNNTDHPVLITTHHDGYRGGSIGVKFWGDNGHIEVTAGSKILARYSKIVLWNVNSSLNHCTYPGPRGSESGSKRISIGTDGFSVEVYQYIDHPDGGRETNTTRWRYVGNYEVWEYNPYPPSGGCGGGTTPPPVTPPPPPGPNPS